MAAQLQPGFRAVAIEVSAETAAGGYVQPNDHVDVIMSHKFQEGSKSASRARSSCKISAYSRSETQPNRKPAVMRRKLPAPTSRFLK